MVSYMVDEWLVTWICFSVISTEYYVSPGHLDMLLLSTMLALVTLDMLLLSTMLALVTRICFY